MRRGFLQMIRTDKLQPFLKRFCSGCQDRPAIRSSSSRLRRSTSGPGHTGYNFLPSKTTLISSLLVIVRLDSLAFCADLQCACVIRRMLTHDILKAMFTRTEYFIHNVTVLPIEELDVHLGVACSVTRALRWTCPLWRTWRWPADQSPKYPSSYIACDLSEKYRNDESIISAHKLFSISSPGPVRRRGANLSKGDANRLIIFIFFLKSLNEIKANFGLWGGAGAPPLDSTVLKVRRTKNSMPRYAGHQWGQLVSYISEVDIRLNPLKAYVDQNRFKQRINAGH